jgi:hypothetical protein
MDEAAADVSLKNTQGEEFFGREGRNVVREDDEIR